MAKTNAVVVGELTTRALSPETWQAFADLAERHNGVWGGCWCTYFHTMHGEKTFTVEGNRALKEQLVKEGRAHAALVFDGEVAVGWCEYGPPMELPNINHRKEYEAGLGEPPDYRLTCFFVDRRYRRQGVSAVALRGALELIAQAGGGVVETYPQDTAGKQITASFLYNGTRSLFERARVHLLPPQGQEPLRDEYYGRAGQVAPGVPVRRRPVVRGNSRLGGDAGAGLVTPVAR
ncbi:GNAT family N-acetyltransferase [Kribbella qitaiheensis]|uniref:GNAT family N-acetyltransferase n=1 Tax=Kribbella qitaiheensis TaxID=1544730 RepID=UPI001FE8EC54|nr:GNAT family N-acetyltransferase [Kribbella qitaiheensis]